MQQSENLREKRLRLKGQGGWQDERLVCKKFVNKIGKTIGVGNKKILIIDDNDHDRKGIVQILKNKVTKTLFWLNREKKGTVPFPYLLIRF